MVPSPNRVAINPLRTTTYRNMLLKTGLRRNSRATRTIQWTTTLVVVACILSKPLALVTISAYQRFVSPHKGWRCAYAVLHGGPSCSAYGKEVISRHGVLGGTLLLWNRFGDCRAAANILAANAPGANAGNECAATCEKIEKDCANGCVRGCTGGQPSVGPTPPPISPPSAFVVHVHSGHDRVGRNGAMPCGAMG